MDIFSNLSKEEIRMLQEAPALVTILIGASDGKLDGEERVWSEKLLRARSYSGKKALHEYYRSVSEGFWVELQHQMAILPSEIKARNKVVKGKLKNLNPILAKLDSVIAYSLYKGFLGLAEEVAKASGGFLRIGAVSATEQEVVSLPMLTPIVAPAGLAEEDEPFEEE